MSQSPDFASNMSSTVTVSELTNYPVIQQPDSSVEGGAEAPSGAFRFGDLNQSVDFSFGAPGLIQTLGFTFGAGVTQQNSGE